MADQKIIIYFIILYLIESLLFTDLRKQHQKGHRP